MNRKELYLEINSLGLRDEIKAIFNKNYTNVSSKDLESVVVKAKKALNPVKYVIPKTVLLNKILQRLVEVLSKKNILLKSEVNYILH